MRRHFTLISLLASLAAVAVLGTACMPTGGNAAPTATPATVMLADFMLEPVDMTVEGPTVSFSVTNNGPTVHNFSIRDGSGEILLATPDLRPGESAMLTGELEPGDYETFCSLPGHESLGMQAALTVTGT